MEEIYRCQIECLKTLYELMNRELAIKEKMLELYDTDLEIYDKYKEIAIKKLEKEEEEKEWN